MIEMLCLISKINDDKKIDKLHIENKLAFSYTFYGNGTASSSLLEYFGLEEVRKYIYLSLIDSSKKNEIFDDILDKLNLKAPGNGICFTVPLSSSTKFIKDKIINKENYMNKIDDETKEKNKNKKEHELIIAIVNEGFSETTMNAAKKKGCSGGTLIKGRSLIEDGAKRKFFGISIEPEKDIILMVVDSKIKKDVMESITMDVGLKTKGNGICFSLPISDAIGLFE